jgi:hypothetical protein
MRRPSRNWSPQLVIESLQDLALEGVPMSVEAVRGLDPGLAKAAYVRFGSWPAAVRAAGLQPVRRSVRPRPVLPKPPAGHGQLRTGQLVRIESDPTGEDAEGFTEGVHVAVTVMDAAENSLFEAGSRWQFARADVRGVG